MTQRKTFAVYTLIALIISAVLLFLAISGILQGVALVIAVAVAFIAGWASLILFISTLTKNPPKTLKKLLDIFPWWP